MTVLAARFEASVLHLVDMLRLAIAEDGRHRLGLRLTAVLVILHGASAPAMNIPLQIVGGALLLFPRALTVPILWWTLVAALAVGNASHWDVIDNHKYLITYWALACALSLRSPTPEAYLRTTAQVLVALVFGLAVLWKLIGGEYLNGAFLYWTFLTDPRVQRVGAAISGASLSDIAVGAQAIRALGTGGVELLTVPVLQLTSLQSFALVVSWFVILGETTVAISHTVNSERLYLARHVSLIGFILATYFLLPVSGFAFVLALLGFAQCRDDDRRLANLYLALLAFIQLTILPWQSLLPTV